MNPAEIHGEIRSQGKFQSFEGTYKRYSVFNVHRFGQFVPQCFSQDRKPHLFRVDAADDSKIRDLASAQAELHLKPIFHL